MKKIILLSLLTSFISSCSMFPLFYKSTTFDTKTAALLASVKKFKSIPAAQASIAKTLSQIDAIRDNLSKKDSLSIYQDSLRTEIKKLKNHNNTLTSYNNKFNRYLYIAMNRNDLGAAFSTRLDTIKKRLIKENLNNTIQSTINNSPEYPVAVNTIKQINQDLQVTRKSIKDWATKNNNTDTLKKLNIAKDTLVKDSTWLSEVKNIINPDSIAPNKFSFLIASYANIGIAPDDDASGLTQFYGYVSVPFKQGSGLKSPTDHFVWFRNIYFQPTFNTGKFNNLNLLDTVINKKTQFYANKLDILQYAYLKTPIDLNILTYIRHEGKTDYFHAYLDAMGGLLFTKDTVKKLPSTLIPSAMYGIHVSAKTESGVSKAFTIEGGFQFFKIVSNVNSFSADLNPQYRNYHQDTLLQNASRSLVGGFSDQTYLNLDLLLVYNANLGTSGATAFLHLDYYTNIPSAPMYHNTYFQLQLGTSINIASIFSSGSSSSSKSSSSTKSN